jgi:hypothetical protein
MIFVLNFKKDLTFSNTDEYDFERHSKHRDISVRADNDRHLLYIHVDDKEYEKSILNKDTFAASLEKDFRKTITEFETNGYISYSEVLEDSDADDILRKDNLL